MTQKALIKIMTGYRKFREKFYSGENHAYEKLSSGQNPKTLIIGCSDSRVDPAILTSASPGDLFVVRNVANLVPPYEQGGGFHGVSAAIEFATVQLKVENIIVLGHRQCGGIRALMSTPVPPIESALSTNSPSIASSSSGTEVSFVSKWVQIAERAKRKVLENFSHEDFETQCRQCEKESIRISLDNLKTFPFIQEAILERNLNLIGVYFDLENGDLFEYDPQQQTFKPLFF